MPHIVTAVDSLHTGDEKPGYCWSHGNRPHVASYPEPDQTQDTNPETDDHVNTHSALNFTPAIVDDGTVFAVIGAQGQVKLLVGVIRCLTFSSQKEPDRLQERRLAELSR